MSDILCPSQIFPALRLGRYRFVVKPEGTISLPLYQGSTWRGVIGNALSNLFCPWPRVRCKDCSARASCAYGFLYESCSDEKGFTSLPRPYIFSPAKNTGPYLSVDMTLIGSGGDFLPHVVAAWEKAGKMGVGKGRGCFTVIEVIHILNKNRTRKIYDQRHGIRYDKTTLPLADYLNNVPPPIPMKVEINAPLRLRNKGKNLGKVNWTRAFTSLAVRLSILNQRFCGGVRPEKDDWSRLMQFFARPGLLKDSTHWFDWKRYSSRRHRHVPMGGFIGQSLIKPEDHEAVWWQWWQTAALFHLGKGVSMGMGKITFKTNNGD